jgi:hypothetical protein
VLWVLLIIAGHAVVYPQLETYAGPLLVVEHLFGLTLALALMGLCFAVGRRALALCRIDADSPLEDLVFSTLLGATLISVCILALGLSSILAIPSLVGVLLVGVAFGWRELINLPDRCARATAWTLEQVAHPSYAFMAVAVFVLAAVVMIVQAFAPPTDWDSLMYHLRIPGQFLEAGRIYWPEDSLHIAWVGLVQMLYIPLLAAGSQAAPAILSVLFALILGLSMYSLGARFFDSATAGVSSSLLWATTSVLLVAITARVDVTHALWVFVAHYALLISLLDRQRFAFYFLAAVLLGSAVGVKYHALAYTLALSPLIVWAAWTHGRDPGRILRSLFLFGSFFLLAALPWLAKNWILLQAPLYPFLADRLLPPWLAEIYGSSTIPAAVDQAVFAALRTARAPFDLIHLFTAPIRLTVEQEGAFYHMNLFYLLIPLSVVFFRKRALTWLIIPALAYVPLILLPSTATNLRYLIPAYAPLTVATAYVAVRMTDRLFPSPGARRLLLISLTALALFPSAKAMYVWFSKSDVLGNLVGATSQQQYLATGYNFYSRMADATNERIPEDAKVLMLFEARGWFFEPEVVQDNILTNWALLAPYANGDTTCLGSTGISHLLLSELALRYYVNRGTDPSVLAWEQFQVFAERCLELTYREPGFALLRLKTISNSGPQGPDD